MGSAYASNMDTPEARMTPFPDQPPDYDRHVLTDVDDDAPFRLDPRRGFHPAFWGPTRPPSPSPYSPVPPSRRAPPTLSAAKPTGRAGLVSRLRSRWHSLPGMCQDGLTAAAAVALVVGPLLFVGTVLGVFQ